MQITNLTGKRHDNATAHILTMLETLAAPYASKFGGVDRAADNALSFESVCTDTKGERRPCFHLPKRGYLILVSGLDGKDRRPLD